MKFIIWNTINKIIIIVNHTIDTTTQSFLFIKEKTFYKY